MRAAGTIGCVHAFKSVCENVSIIGAKQTATDCHLKPAQIAFWDVESYISGVTGRLPGAFDLTAAKSKPSPRKPELHGNRALVVMLPGASSYRV